MVNSIEPSVSKKVLLVNIELVDIVKKVSDLNEVLFVANKMVKNDTFDFEVHSVIKKDGTKGEVIKVDVNVVHSEQEISIGIF